MDFLDVVDVVHQLGVLARRVVTEHYLQECPAAGALATVQRRIDRKSQRAPKFPVGNLGYRCRRFAV